MGGLTANGNSLSIVRGDSGTLCLDLYMGRDLFNLTFGDRGVLTVKKDVKDEEIILQKEMKDDASFAFEPEDTKNVKPGRYVYDIQLTFYTGEVVTVCMGKFRVTADVTTEVRS